MRAFECRVVAVGLFLAFAFTGVCSAQGAAVVKESVRFGFPAFGVNISQPVILGLWINSDGLPEASAENPALREELDRGDITVDQAWSINASRLCLNDEFGYSYTRSGKMHVGVCPSAINMVTEVSTILRLIAYERAAGTLPAALEAFTANWGEAVGQSIVDVNLSAVLGKSISRCSGLYRYYLWKSVGLKPSSCEDSTEQAHITAYWAWFELVTAGWRVDEPQWPLTLLGLMKGIVRDRRAVITYILLHELGHHRLQHHVNRRPDHGQEMEADKFAFERMWSGDVFAVASIFRYLLALDPKNEIARTRLKTIGDTMLTLFSLEQLKRFSIQDRRNLMQEIGAPESDGDRPESARHRVIEAHERFLSFIK